MTVIRDTFVFVPNDLQWTGVITVISLEGVLPTDKMTMAGGDGGTIVLVKSLIIVVHKLQRTDHHCSQMDPECPVHSGKAPVLG